MPLNVGDRLGPYAVTAKIGEGGMGEVYRAHDTKLDRDVAVKVLPDTLANDAGALKRFQQEARPVAALNHPNVVTIHAVDESDGVHFLAMELANVMITAAGRIKVLDFGLAKFVGLRHEQEATLTAPQALECFTQAVALDPDFAQAWTGVADAHTVLGQYGFVHPAKTMPQAKAAALRAVALDDTLAEAHGALGGALLLHDWDADAAERALERAVGARRIGPAPVGAWYTGLRLQHQILPGIRAGASGTAGGGQAGLRADAPRDWDVVRADDADPARRVTKEGVCER